MADQYSYNPGAGLGFGEAGRGGGITFTRRGERRRVQPQKRNIFDNPRTGGENLFAGFHSDAGPTTFSDLPVGEKKEETDPFIDYLLGIRNTLDKSVINPMSAIKSSGSFLLDVLHQLGRPGSGVLTGIKEGTKSWKDPESWDGVVGRTGLGGGFPIPLESIKKGAKGFLKGFTYEDETRGQHFLSEKFRKDHPALAFMLGFGIDVVSDPLTFGAAKAITLPVEAGAKGLVKLGAKSEFLSGAAQRMSASSIADALNIHIGEAREIKKMADAFRDRLKGSQTRAENFMKERQIELRKIAEEAGIDIEDLNIAILDDIEKGTIGTADSVTARISDDAARIAGEDKSAYDELLRLEQEAGVNISDLIERASELGIEGYIPHVATLAARKKLKKGWRDWTKPVTKTHALERKHAGPISEINERMATREDALSGSPFMHTDPALLRALRTSRSAQEMAYVNFNDAVRKFGFDEASFPQGRYPKDFVSIEGIDGVKFPPSLARTITRQRNILRNKDVLDDYLKYADKLQNVWKMWTLGVRPAYHMRNLAGNLWNAYTVAGVKNPGVFNKARQMQITALLKTNPSLAKKFGVTEQGQLGGFHLTDVFKAKGGIEKSYEEIFDKAIDMGVMGKGQYGVGSDVLYNLERDLERAATRGDIGAVERIKSLITPTTENIMLRGGFKVGNVIEDNARLAIFLDTFKKTGSFDEAAHMVKKALFDYSDLSPFERTVMKRVMPFYTWTRKNIPAQVEALWKNPERGRKLDIARTQIEFELGRPDPQNVYDFYNRGVPLYLGKEEKGEVWKMYRMLNYLPIADLERSGDFVQMWNEMQTPLLKAPREFFNNYDTFRNKQIEEYKGQTTDFLGIRMPVRMAHLAKLLVPIAELNRANPFGMFGEAYKDKEGNWSRTKSWGMEQPLVGFEIPQNIPMVGGKYEFGGTERESTRDQPAGIRFMQYAFGLRPYYVSAGEGRKYRVKNFNKDLRSLNYYLHKAEQRGQKRRAQELLGLIRQWKSAEKRAELDKSKGKVPDYSFRGSRYYEEKR